MLNLLAYVFPINWLTTGSGPVSVKAPGWHTVAFLWHVIVRVSKEIVRLCGVRQLEKDGTKMKSTLHAFLACLATAVVMTLPSVSQAQSLWLDFQPTGGTTAAGYQAFEATNQVIPTEGTSYSAFGSTVTVSLAAANLPDGNLDFRSVARNGAAGDLENDWIGLDTRNAGVDVTFTISVDGLPAGDYNWLSTHHDGGAGATNGNLSGTPDYTFTDATGSSTGVLSESSQNDGDPIATFLKSFTSDGVAPVSLSMVMDNGQGDTPDTALFVFANGVQISLVPEPSALTLVALALVGIAVRRRRAI